MERNSFVLFTEIVEVIKELTNEQKGILFQTILDYQLGIVPKIDDPIVKIAFIPIKQNLDRNNEKWERTRAARSEAGKKGMRSRWDNKAITNDNKNNKAISEITKITVNVNENENVNENVNVNEKKSGDKPQRSFKAPTLEEVRSYCAERRNGVDAQHFMDFYESKGWFIGKNKMKDWKAAVRTWEQRSRSSSSKIEIDDNFRRAMRESEVVDFGI